jgi:hypothetical protein
MTKDDPQIGKDNNAKNSSSTGTERSQSSSEKTTDDTSPPISDDQGTKTDDLEDERERSFKEKGNGTSPWQEAQDFGLERD